MRARRDTSSISNNVAARVRVLPEHADARISEISSSSVSDLYFNAQRFASRSDHSYRLGMTLFISKEGHGALLLAVLA